VSGSSSAEQDPRGDEPDFRADVDRSRRSEQGRRPGVSEPFGAVIRTSAFVRKEAVEVLRQPRLLVLLVLGPFLVLALFGAGLRDVDPPPHTLFVAPEGSELVRTVTEFAAAQDESLVVEGIISDREEALAQLEAGEIDLVIVFPEDVTETVRSDEQAVITLFHNQMDPVESRAIELLTQSAVDEANRQLLAEVVTDAQEETEDLSERVATARQRAGDLRQTLERDEDAAATTQVEGLQSEILGIAAAAGPALALAGASDADTGDLEERIERIAALGEELGDDGDDVSATEVAELEEELAEVDDALEEFRSLSPQVVAAPFRGEAIQIAEGVELGDYYAPAVLVVLLQHLLVTALGLSLVRERELGTTELYQVAPLRPGEIVAGKYLAHLLVALVVGAALLALMVLVLGVPLRGDPVSLGLAILAVCLASAGVGFLVSLAARSDSQAVQYAMLVLLLTVFFSGFILSVERFIPEVGWVAWLVPATYGIELLRDVMLRGIPPRPLLLVALVVMGLGLGAVSWLWLRLRMRTR
jgi:ABC-2 type transport system permease protein